uniref:Uncharacterized protein n=1 Tax=Anguilla anguilla TaxID=7936 RepID=A0A0E9URU2_ANGAN
MSQGNVLPVRMPSDHIFLFYNYILRNIP